MPKGGSKHIPRGLVYIGVTRVVSTFTFMGVLRIYSYLHIISFTYSQKYWKDMLRAMKVLERYAEGL